MKQTVNNMKTTNPELKNQKKGLNNISRNFSSGNILKLLVIFIAGIIVSANSYGQTDWGIEAGGNFSTQSDVGNICDNGDFKGGLNFGISASYDLNDWIALRTGISYLEKGKKFDADDQIDGEIKESFRYLTLPVKMEFSAGERAGLKNGNRLFFAAGPYAGYLTDAVQKFDNESVSIKESVDDVDFGLSFELGFEFPVSKDNALRATLGYDMGLTKIRQEDCTWRNKTLALKLGYFFN